MKYKYIFTITGGRTGTAWLADLLRANLNIQAVHEPLDTENFGVDMPDIKLMRLFNEKGNILPVIKFFAAKLTKIGELDSYAETNHTLAKAGLVENLTSHPISRDSCLIILKRDVIERCLSHLQRSDFQHLTLIWQWYLSPAYPNRIVDPKPFLEHGIIGATLWYCHEMDARQHFYKTAYSSKIAFIETNLSEITSDKGGLQFLKEIGGAPNEILLPKAINQSSPTDNHDLRRQLVHIQEKINCDPKLLAHKFIKMNKTLG